MACGVVDDEMIDRPLSTDVGASCRGVPMSIGIDFGDIAGAPAATHRAVIPMKGLPKGGIWRHGVSFQHDNYGDAAPDVDTEHTTRRGGPGGQLSAVV
jgi:hypothetical protein